MLTLTDYNDWEYLNKGAANAVFKYTGSDDNLHRKVLRLRLKTSAITTKEICQYIKESFVKLDQYIMPMNLVSVSREFVDGLQEKTGVKLNLSDLNGILMDNIFDENACYETVKLNKHLIFHLGTNDETNTLFEFKPKWLYQPPADFNYCRNCSLLKLKSEENVVCNLKLLNKESMIDWCTIISNKLGETKEGSETIKNLLIEAVTANYEAIQLIYELQNRTEFDIHGKLLNLQSEKDVDDFLQFSMTLKDMTIFVDLNSKKLTILDLDRKPTTKWSSWQKQEMNLRSYYHLPLN